MKTFSSKLLHLFDIHYFTRILPTIFGNYIDFFILGQQSTDNGPQTSFIILFILNHLYHIKFEYCRFGDTFIQFIPYQYKNTVKINPYHKDNQASDRTIKKVVSRNVRDIKIE